MNVTVDAEFTVVGVAVAVTEMKLTVTHVSQI